MTSPTKPGIFSALATGTGAAPAPGQNPFAQLVSSLPQQGWANPNAQAWTQQALGQPFMQGWTPPAGAVAAPGATPGTPGAAGAGAPLTDAQWNAAANTLSKNQNKQQQDVMTGFLTGLATGGPAGAFTNLALSAFTANKDGFYGTGIDGGWAKKTLIANGWRPAGGAHGAMLWMSPDGKKVPQQGAVRALLDIINTQGIQPKMT